MAIAPRDHTYSKHNVGSKLFSAMVCGLMFAAVNCPYLVYDCCAWVVDYHCDKSKKTAPQRHYGPSEAKSIDLISGTQGTRSQNASTRPTGCQRIHSHQRMHAGLQRYVHNAK